MSDNQNYHRDIMKIHPLFVVSTHTLEGKLSWNIIGIPDNKLSHDYDSIYLFFVPFE